MEKLREPSMQGEERRVGGGRKVLSRVQQYQVPILQWLCSQGFPKNFSLIDFRKREEGRERNIYLLFTY